MLVCYETAPRQFWSIAVVTRLLSSRDSKIAGSIARIVMTILECHVNKLFTVENTYHDTNQTDNVREQKLRGETAVIGELKRKCEC